MKAVYYPNCVGGRTVSYGQADHHFGFSDTLIGIGGQPVL
jgi:hypothetical protein